MILLPASRLENEASGRAVDSLINYETVKYFGAEEHEVRYWVGGALCLRGVLRGGAFAAFRRTYPMHTNTLHYRLVSLNLCVLSGIAV